MMPLQRVEARKPGDLRPHPKNAEIYGDHADPDLVDSIRSKGVLNPLLVTEDGRIISGHRRWDAAKRSTRPEVPVVVFGSMDELDILEALIESNRQREKTNEQLGREYAVLKHIITERNKQRMTVDQSTVAPYPSRAAATEVGVHYETAHKAESVVKVIDDLRQNGKAREAEQLRTTLNTSVRKAYDRAKEDGHIQVTPRAEPATPKGEFVTLGEWGGMLHEERLSLVEMGRNDPRAKFNAQEENKIEWAYWSWNPVSGCLHNCSYCYARDIAERFYPQKFVPSLYPMRFSAPYNTKVPPEAETQLGYKNVFTCSMADLFGRWVPREWIEAVLHVVADNPQWNFLFLTKFPSRLTEFDFPQNAWVGTSVDAQARVVVAEAAFSKVNAPVKWLSCEPLLEPLRFSRLDLFNWIVIGGASASTQTPAFRPPRPWIEDLERQARAVGCKVYEKENLLDRIREYPGAPMNGHVVIPDAFKMGYLQRDIHTPDSYHREVVTPS